MESGYLNSSRGMRTANEFLAPLTSPAAHLLRCSESETVSSENSNKFLVVGICLQDMLDSLRYFTRMTDPESIETVMSETLGPLILDDRVLLSISVLAETLTKANLKIYADWAKEPSRLASASWSRNGTGGSHK